MRHKGMTFCKLLVLLVLTLLLTGCAQQPQAPFDGVIATSDVVFNLDFTALNSHLRIPLQWLGRNPD